MILIYISLNELIYKKSCFNVDADISISNRYPESATREREREREREIKDWSNFVFCCGRNSPHLNTIFRVQFFSCYFCILKILRLLISLFFCEI